MSDNAFPEDRAESAALAARASPDMEVVIIEDGLRSADRAVEDLRRLQARLQTLRQKRLEDAERRSTAAAAKVPRPKPKPERRDPLEGQRFCEIPGCNMWNGQPHPPHKRAMQKEAVNG